MQDNDPKHTSKADEGSEWMMKVRHGGKLGISKTAFSSVLSNIRALLLSSPTVNPTCTCVYFKQTNNI